MTSRIEITDAVMDAIRDTNALLPPGGALEVSEGAGLLEPPGQLDSLGLVNLLVAVETRCLTALGATVSLVDSIQLPPEESPFRSVQSLVDHLERVLAAGAMHA
jgi:hypothetical protein